jgi:hypothetical protein
MERIMLEDLLACSNNYALTTEDTNLYNSPQYKNMGQLKLITNPKEMDKLIKERFEELENIIKDDIRRGLDDNDGLAYYKETKEYFLKTIGYLEFDKFPFITTDAIGGPICCDWDCVYHRYTHISLTTERLDKIMFVGLSYPKNDYEFSIMVTLDQIITKANTRPNKKLIFPKDIITWER